MLWSRSGLDLACMVRTMTLVAVVYTIAGAYIIAHKGGKS